MIKEIFNDVKKHFPEVHANLKQFNNKSFMKSSPLTKNIYYNKKQLEKFKFSKMAIKGALAHELAHKIAYKNMNFLERILFKFKYKNMNFRKKEEREADIIAVKKGFGKELIKLFKESEKKFDKERFIKIKKTHLSIKEIKDLE